MVARLLSELPIEVPQPLIEKAKVIDGFYIPTGMPMGTRKALPSSTMELSKARMRLIMPVKSLNSSVLKWPDRSTVDRAARSWAANEVVKHPELLRLGYFGSYARGDAGVGSDLDLIAIVGQDSEPFERRSLTWDLNAFTI